MKYTIQNLARRPVTLICNSGRALHLPPKYEHEVAEVDIKNNKMFEKLLSKHLVSLKQQEEKGTRAKKKGEEERQSERKKES